MDSLDFNYANAIETHLSIVATNKNLLGKGVSKGNAAQGSIRNYRQRAMNHAPRPR